MSTINSLSKIMCMRDVERKIQKINEGKAFFVKTKATTDAGRARALNRYFRENCYTPEDMSCDTVYKGKGFVLLEEL